MRYSIIGATIEQVKRVGGQDVKEARSTGIIFATLNEVQVNKLKAAGCAVKRVGGVEPAIMPPIIAPPPPIEAPPVYSAQELMWMIGLDELRGITDPPLYGKGFNVAIIDTGIRETHERINNRVVYRENFTGAPHRDGFDHGTGVAEIVLEVAPEAGLLDLKVMDDQGRGSEEGVVLAIDEAISLWDEVSPVAPHILNLSLGAPDDGDPNNPLRVACRAAINKGIWVIAAAGNAGAAPGTVMTPACERYVVAVGSVRPLPDDKTFTISNFSSRGPTPEGLIKPDAVIFGENIVMASSASDTATVHKSGTSFASPFAAGIAALYHEAVLAYGGVRYTEEIRPEEFFELVEMVSVEQLLDTYLPGLCIKPQGAPAIKDYDYGHGLPFGPLIKQAFSPVPALISSMMPMVTGVMMIGMMGMMIRGISNNRNGR